MEMRTGALMKHIHLLVLFAAFLFTTRSARAEFITPNFVCIGDKKMNTYQAFIYLSEQNLGKVLLEETFAAGEKKQSAEIPVSYSLKRNKIEILQKGTMYTKGLKITYKAKKEKANLKLDESLAGFRKLSVNMVCQKRREIGSLVAIK